MIFGVNNPRLEVAVRQAAAASKANLRRATIIGVDKATREAHAAMKTKIRSVGLGRLGNAVGYTTTLKQGDKAGRDPFGVLFARGGDESLAGGALESYSRGATIRANQKQWLAFQTNALPRRVGRKRLTPELYRSSGLENSIGKLIFRPIGPDKALLVVQKVTLSPKTGRAKAAGKRPSRTRVPQKEIVAFILIRVTRRAQRFDKDAIVFKYAKRVPEYIAEALARIDRQS